MAPFPQPDQGRDLVVPAGSPHDAARVEALVALAHEHALRAHAAEVEAGDLRWQQRHDPETVRLRAELAAVSAELDRLRGLLELRVGQRVRHVASVLRRPAAGPSPESSSEPPSRRDGARAAGDAADPAGRAEADTLRYPPVPPPCVVLVVRNRPASVQLALDWLEQHGVGAQEVVDNASSDPTLFARLGAIGVPVTRVPADLGPAAAWASGALARRLRDANVLVIDVDGHGVTLPEASCPADVLDRMAHELARQPDLDAVELSPSSEQDPGRFRMIRRGLESVPATIGRLDAPYRSATASPDRHEPSERFAALHDQRELDAGR